MNLSVRTPNSPGTFWSSAFPISFLPGSACAAQDACLWGPLTIWSSSQASVSSWVQVSSLRWFWSEIQFLSSEDEARLRVTVHSPKGDLSVKPAGLSLHRFVHLQLHPCQQWVKPKAGPGLVSSSFISSFIPSGTVYSEHFSSHFATTSNSINIM